MGSKASLTTTPQAGFVEIAGVAHESVVDGPGLRSVVFAQGCLHKCPGCHNPSTHEFGRGTMVTIPELITMLRITPLTDGVTLSGGDPFYQPVAFAELVEQLRAERPTIDILAYSGFTFEELTVDRGSGRYRLLSLCDYLVDGRFELHLRDPRIAFRGSRNQRIIDVQRSLKAGVVVDISDRYDRRRAEGA